MELEVSRCYDCPFCQSNRLNEPWYCAAPGKKPYYYWNMAKIDIITPEWCPLPIIVFYHNESAVNRSCDTRGMGHHEDMDM